MVACPWPAKAFGWVLLVAGLLLLQACGTVIPVQGGAHPPATVAAAPRPESQLRAFYSGCREARSSIDGLVCMLEPDAELTLWAGVGPGVAAVLTIDGMPMARPPEAVDGGLRWKIRPRPPLRRIEVHADLDGASSRFVMTLVMEARLRVAELERLEALPETRVARRKLVALLPELKGEPLALGLELAGDLATFDGDVDGMIEAYARGFVASNAVGWWHEASIMAQRIAHACLVRYDDGCARQWLERDVRLVASDSEQRMYHAYYQGLLAEHAGDLRVALRAYRESEQQARALGFAALEAGVLVQELLLAGHLGDHERAQALRRRAEELVSTLDDPLMRSQLINGIAWMLLEARGRGLPSQDPVPLLQHALALVEESTGAIETPQHDAILINLAYAAVLEGNARAARRWLDGVARADLAYENRVWKQLLRARIAWLEGDPEVAQRRLVGLLAAADHFHEPELRWHALVGQGEALEALGRPAHARGSYQAAEALLETQLPRIALGGGRERFMAERSRSARRLVDLLLRQADEKSALCAARLARTRTLRTLMWQLRSAALDPEARDELQRRSRERTRIESAWDASWTLPAGAARAVQRELEREREANDEALDRVLAKLVRRPSTYVCEQLPAVAAGELHLHYMQLDDGWVGFAVDEGDIIVVKRLGPLSLEDATRREAWPRLGDALLRPFASQIAKAQRIRIMTTGELTGVPFQALPVRGEQPAMLLDLAAVRYGLDLPMNTPDVAPRASPTGRAMIVVPPSNLPNAEVEALDARAALEERSLRVSVLAGDDARGNAVREALPHVDLLHYVGHARSGGLSGWDSALVLARGDVLGVDDVLALRRAPTTVVLGGCETGMADPHALAGGMSLAHAFVLAGSRSVLATSNEVDDATAAALMKALYEALPADEASDVDEALRAAQRGKPHEGWLNVRIFGP